jgi:hypothetical protein
MNIKKSNIFLYPLDNKVVFPYHEYTFSINSNQYDCKYLLIHSWSLRQSHRLHN